MERDVIVIGGGAAGIVAAIIAARKGAKVTILEHKDKLGKKILATGNGKCNYTNKYQSIDCYRSENLPFVEEVFSHFNAMDTVDFFSDLGIYPKDRNGYLYPASEQASSIVDVLIMELNHLKVEVLCNEEVKSIVQTMNACYLVETIENQGKPNDIKSGVTDNKDRKPIRKQYVAKKVIVATGGKASSKLGSDGSGYYFLEKLGHQVVPVVPALVQLKAEGELFDLVSGVRCDALVEVEIDGSKVAKDQGELQLTNYGISGIPVFQISRYAAKALLKKQKVYVNIDFMPQLSSDELIKMVQARIDKSPYKTPEQLLTGLFNQKLIQMFLLELTKYYKKQGIDKDFGCTPVKTIKKDKKKKQNSNQILNKNSECNSETKCSSELFNKGTIIQLVKIIKRFSVRINDTNSFENAQVCAGGIDTRQINSSTMESKICRGIYVVGEVLDVDGICGGYNLQWAWSTGFIAGEAAGSC